MAADIALLIMQNRPYRPETWRFGDKRSWRHRHAEIVLVLWRNCVSLWNPPGIPTETR